MGLWEFKQFTFSRLATVGTSCRAVAVALLSGFDSLVATVRADPRASDFYIHGYSKLTQLAKHFVVCAALVSYPSEAFMLELASDSRVPRRFGGVGGHLATISFLLG